MPPGRTLTQERPLQTTDAETVRAEKLRAQIGFDSLQVLDFPLFGLSGDETSVGVLNVRMGEGRIAEVKLQGAIHSFLEVKSRGASFVPSLQLTGVHST